MTNTIVIVLLVFLIAGFIVLTVLLLVRLGKLSDTSNATVLKQDLVELNRELSELKDSVGGQLTKSQTNLQTSLQKQFSESNKIITDVTARLTKLDETNRQVKDVADDLKTLQNVLQNPKQRGVVGEYFLQTVLENVLPPGRFELQHRFDDGEVVDAVIFLDKQQVLPIDSKFPLENYNRLVDTTDKTRRAELAKAVKSDLKKRIDETAKYIRPSEKTMEFAFMFIPSEAIYYDLLINKIDPTGVNARDLIEYAFQEKHVIIVSPTSFMAYLQTVLQGLRSLQIEEQAKDIQVRVGQLGRHINAYEDYLKRLGNSLSTTVNHYNTAHKELKKIDKDIVKIAKTNPSIEPLIIDKPQNDD